MCEWKEIWEGRGNRKLAMPDKLRIETISEV
jgi:hypothetical protein